MTKNLLVVLALAGLASQASATVATSTAPSTGQAFIAAPSSTQGVSKLKGCVLSNNNATAYCVTVAAAATAGPSFMLCAGATTTFTLGGVLQSSNGPAAGNVTAAFGEDLVSTGTWTATGGGTTQSGVLLSCSYQYQTLR